MTDRIQDALADALFALARTVKRMGSQVYEHGRRCKDCAHWIGHCEHGCNVVRDSRVCIEYERRDQCKP